MDPVTGGILGIVQGATEFLPISSSGHLVVAGHLLKTDVGAEEGSWAAVAVLLHLGTLAAVVLYYRRDLRDMLLALFRRGASRGQEQHRGPAASRRLLALIVVGTVPAAAAGLAFEGPLEHLFDPRHVGLVGTFLLVSGGLVYLAARLQVVDTAAEAMSWWDALLIGIGQACALVPGVSRSGATIAVGRACGLGDEAAPRFAFLLSVPAILGGTIVELDSLRSLHPADISSYAVGFIAAMLSGIVAIHIVIRTLQQRRFYIFAVYCWLLGGVLLLAELL